MTAQGRNRLLLGLIALLFLLPFTIAVVLRFSGWQPPQTRNYGDLLEPPVSLRGTQAELSDGEPWHWENTERDWTLLARAPATCTPSCREQLQVLGKVRQALGRHAEHLHLFQLAPAGGDEAVDGMDMIRLQGELPELLAAPLKGELPEVWLADPHGYLVMHYPAGFDPSGLRRDLARLLR